MTLSRDIQNFHLYQKIWKTMLQNEIECTDMSSVFYNEINNDLSRQLIDAAYHVRNLGIFMLGV